MSNDNLKFFYGAYNEMDDNYKPIENDKIAEETENFDEEIYQESLGHESILNQGRTVEENEEIQQENKTSDFVQDDGKGKPHANIGETFSPLVATALLNEVYSFGCNFIHNQVNKKFKSKREDWKFTEDEMNAVIPTMERLLEEQSFENMTPMNSFLFTIGTISFTKAFSIISHYKEGEPLEKKGSTNKLSKTKKKTVTRNNKYLDADEQGRKLPNPEHSYWINNPEEYERKLQMRLNK